MSECQDCGSEYPPVRGAHPMYCESCVGRHEQANRNIKVDALTNRLKRKRERKKKRTNQTQKKQSHTSTKTQRPSLDKAPVVLRCDGACHNNPSPYTGVGMALIRNGEVMEKWGACTDASTNIEAEYSSIVEGLRGAISREVDYVRVLNDNKTVVNQINGRWRTKATNLQPFRKRVVDLLDQFVWWSVQWVPREENDIVDSVANEYCQKSLERGHPVVQEANSMDREFESRISR